MKKITGLAATMALGLAFCGFCTGCAAGVKQNTEAPSVPAASVSADGGYKVILNPGIHVNGTTKATIEASAASKVTKADPDTYFVENGYIANYEKGDDLPKAETARTGVTFAGWRYAVEGVPTIVTKMPDVTKLDGDLYLYAHWTVGSGSSGGGDGGGEVDPEKEIKLSANSAVFKFKDATVVIKLGYVPIWGTDPYVYIGGTEWADRYALDGSSTYTVSSNIATVTQIYVGFMQGTAGKSAKVIKGSDLTSGKVNIVHNAKGETSDDYNWDGDNWEYTLALADIEYK